MMIQQLRERSLLHTEVPSQRRLYLLLLCHGGCAMRRPPVFLTVVLHSRSLILKNKNLILSWMSLLLIHPLFHRLKVYMSKR